MAEFNPDTLEYDENESAFLPSVTIDGSEVHCEIHAPSYEDDMPREAIISFAEMCADLPGVIKKIKTQIIETYHASEFVPRYESWFEDGYIVEDVFPNAEKVEDVTPQMSANALEPWKICVTMLAGDPHVTFEFGFAKADADHYVLAEMDVHGTISNILIES